jgi:replicative DNA helicase
MLSDLRECVTGDTLVVLANGSRVPIRDLVGMTPEVLAVAEGGVVVPARSDAVWPVGEREIHEVLLASGRTIRATGRHRFLTGSGWRRLEDLVAGARIALSRTIPEPDSPVEWHPDEAALLGHLVGDGSYLSGQPLRYTTASEENSELVARVARERFGCTVNRHKGTGNWHQLVISRNGNRWHPVGVNAWLRELGVFDQRSSEKCLPRSAFTLSNECVATLLRHLWATDGCIWVSRTGAPRARVYFATCSRSLAHDVAHLLLRFGIVARIRGRVSTGASTVYSVDVSGATDQRLFLEHVGAFGPRVQAAQRLHAMLDECVANTNVDTLPHEVFDEIRASIRERNITTRAMAAARGTSYGGSSHFAFSPSRAQVLEYAEILEDANLAETATNDLYWDRVVSVTPAGVETVYDLTVPGPASWLADGIVSHNSGAIEQDADIVMFLDRETNPHAEEEEGRPARGTAELIVAKHRNGPTGNIPLVFMDRYTKFVDMTKRG